VTGSGVIFEVSALDGSAKLLTNHHVIEGANSITVLVRDSVNYTGTLLGADPNRDLAVVLICCDTSFQALEFADALAEGPGSGVIAIGYPLGVDTATVTKGIVSAVYYDANTSRWLIQTDAPINPGNSGGPLLSLAGRILGINTFIIREARSGVAVEGFGFAVARQTILQVLPDLKSITFVPLPTVVPPSYSQTQFGPSDGSLPHNTGDGLIEEFNTNVSVLDAVIEARFFNPYSPSTGSWDYGFILRHPSQGVFQAIVLRSDGNWYQYERTGTLESSQLLANQWSSAINTGAGGTNDLKLVVLGDKLWLFINGTYVRELQAGASITAGTVKAINGYFNGDGIDGQSTRFEGLTVRSLQPVYGPSSGSLVHNPDSGLIETHDSGVDLTEVVIEARFFNPYSTSTGPWDYGFMLRNSGFNIFHSVIVTSTGYWYHYVRTGTVESSQMLDGQRNSAISTGVGTNNQIRIIVLGNDAWLFINQVFVAQLSLTDLVQPGDISVSTGNFSGNTIAGSSTEFQDFTVWALQ
jgi:hypothetical protein